MFHSRSFEEEVTEKDKEGNNVTKNELKIDIKMMSNLINELRLKINIIMAGDYGLDEKDVEIANKLNEMNKKKDKISGVDLNSPIDTSRLTH